MVLASIPPRACSAAFTVYHVRMRATRTDLEISDRQASGGFWTVTTRSPMLEQSVEPSSRRQKSSCPPPRPFRLVYRFFRRIEFDPAKSGKVFELRGFDLAYVSRLLPGYVLEREDTRDHPEPRYQAIGELLGVVFFVVYARRSDTCRLVAAWITEPHERELWHDITR
jgi:uncharacterized DUF497 family protein